MRQSKIINGLPVTADKCGDQENESAFRLVEIGNHHVDYTEFKTGNYNYAGA